MSLFFTLPHLPLCFSFVLFEIDNQGLEVCFCGWCCTVMHGRPGICVRGERVGAILEEHAEGFEFAGGGGMVEGRVTGYVGVGKDGRTVEDECGDEVEGAGAGFTGKHELGY